MVTETLLLGRLMTVLKVVVLFMFSMDQRTEFCLKHRKLSMLRMSLGLKT